MVASHAARARFVGLGLGAIGLIVGCRPKDASRGGADAGASSAPTAPSAVAPSRTVMIPPSASEAPPKRDPSDASDPGSLTRKYVDFLGQRGGPLEGVAPIADQLLEWTIGDAPIAATMTGPGICPRYADRMTRYRALILPVRIRNVSRETLSFLAAHEWYGGIWPKTDLYACVERIGETRPDRPSCQEVYVAPEGCEVSRQVLHPGEDVVLPLRMDWAGTGSVHGTPFMAPNAAATYEIALVVVVRRGEARSYQALPRRAVKVVPAR